MLLGHIEEEDEVLHCQFSGNSDDEESEGQEKSRIRYVPVYPFNKYYNFIMEYITEDVVFSIKVYLFHFIKEQIVFVNLLSSNVL